MDKHAIALAPVTGSVELSWQCTNPGPALVFTLGELKGRAGRKYVINAVAYVERLPAGTWRWTAFVGGGSRWGFEPNRDHAMKAAEDALPNKPDETRGQ